MPPSLHRNLIPIIDSLLNRLEVVEEIEILTDSDLLQRYDHLWQNVHWFANVQTIYPSVKESQEQQQLLSNGAINDSLPQERLLGAKTMQESLLMYKFEAVEASQNKSLILPASPSLTCDSIAMADICSRLLNASKEIAVQKDLQVSGAFLFLSIIMFSVFSCLGCNRDEAVLRIFITG